MLPFLSWKSEGRADMEANPPLRSSLLGVLLQVGRLSALVVRNRVHLYSFLLVKIGLFRCWVLGLAQEARGSCSTQAYLFPEADACSLGQALRAALTLLWVPVWLLLWWLRLLWSSGLGCVGTLGLALQRLSACEWRGLPVVTWRELLLTCLHSLMLVALLLLLLPWRLFQKVKRFSLSWLPGQDLLWEPLGRMRRLYWWAEHGAALASWHLAYLITWTTCLASHLLQAAFEHTAQLAEAQDADPQEAGGPLQEPPLPEGSTPKAEPALPEPGE
ncbi:transmembrane protein 270 isoform X1 [Dipodomys merriami]|uniref:transmembrane protein 270 isoform X1 n=2 Tax=Dipodomys merriami TaxID=94247 RepID=UPI003855A28C